MVPPVPDGCAPVPQVPLTGVVSSCASALQAPSGCTPASGQVSAASSGGVEVSSVNVTSRPASKLVCGSEPPDDLELQAPAAAVNATSTMTLVVGDWDFRTRLI